MAKFENLENLEREIILEKIHDYRENIYQWERIITELGATASDYFVNAYENRICEYRSHVRRLEKRLESMNSDKCTI